MLHLSFHTQHLSVSLAIHSVRQIQSKIKMNSYYIECIEKIEEKQLLREYLISDAVVLFVESEG